MAADVAGYSRLMGVDEGATLAALDACRAVFREEAAGRGGRVVDMAGDSVLAAFDSVVEAVACAVAVQARLAERAAGEPEGRRMLFRVGINLGDVLVKADGSVYGDGVNVAARLQELAEPGGLVISGSAHDQVEGKTGLSFADIGEHAAKNIARPVRAWRLQGESGFRPAEAEQAPPLPTKPSIAVLPFDNMSGDPEQEYFADGIAEDLITALSRLRWLFVVARNSTFTYKRRAVDVKQVGRALGVRYVVEGSVRRGGARVRITVQLVDATTGDHVWAERYDRALDDLFDLQDEITGAVAAAIEPAISEVERQRARRKPPDNLNAWESYQRGLWHLHQFTKQDIAAAQDFFTRATALDGHFAPPHGALAYALYLDVLLGFAPSREETISRAIAAGRQGIALDDKDPMSHFGLGRALYMAGEHEISLRELEIAVKLNPNFALAYLGLGTVRISLGRPAEAVEALDVAIRLSPHDPILWTMENARAVAKIALGEFEQALDDARLACRHPNTGYWSYLSLASALGHLNRLGEARSALDKAFQIKPDLTWDSIRASAPPSIFERTSQWSLGLEKAGFDVQRETSGID